jgi:hypothetical protein
VTPAHSLRTPAHLCLSEHNGTCDYNRLLLAPGQRLKSKQTPAVASTAAAVPFTILLRSLLRLLVPAPALTAPALPSTVAWQPPMRTSTTTTSSFCEDASEPARDGPAGSAVTTGVDCWSCSRSAVSAASSAEGPGRLSPARLTTALMWAMVAGA